MAIRVHYFSQRTKLASSFLNPTQIFFVLIFISWKTRLNCCVNGAGRKWIMLNYILSDIFTLIYIYFEFEASFKKLIPRICSHILKSIIWEKFLQQTPVVMTQKSNLLWLVSSITYMNAIQSCYLFSFIISFSLFTWCYDSSNVGAIYYHLQWKDLIMKAGWAIKLLILKVLMTIKIYNHMI